MGVCKYTVPPNKDLDVDTQYKRGCTSDQGCPRFPVVCLGQVPGRSQMFKTGPQMDDNNDFFFQLSKSGGKSPIGILNKVGPFQEILKIVTNLFIFDRSCQKTITLLVSYKR